MSTPPSSLRPPLTPLVHELSPLHVGRHHALLLTSQDFATRGLSPWEVASLAHNLCGNPLLPLDFKIAPFDLQKTTPPKENPTKKGKGHSSEAPSPEALLWARLSRNPDVTWVDRERPTLRLEDVENLRLQALFPPIDSKRRLLWVPGAERLNPHSANALLKLVEEPPSPCLFVFTCAKPAEVLPTITSRCQKAPVRLEGVVRHDPLQAWESEDLGWLSQQIKNLLDGKPVGVKIAADILQKSDALAKKHTPSELRDTLALLLAQEAQKRPEFPSVLRPVLARMSAWKEAEPLHPSSALWLYSALISRQGT